MNDEHTQCERLSALADGQLQGEEFTQAMHWACTTQGQATWVTYHVIGDALRSAELAQHGHSDILTGIRARLAQETPPLQPLPTAVLEQIAVPAQTQAANASLFRWKMAAGFASLAAVSAIGWHVALHELSGNSSTAARATLAVAQPNPAPLLAHLPAPPAPLNPLNPPAPQFAGAQQPPTATLSHNSSVMLRDPRLDELMAAHKQYGATTTLQMPAGFLRNANFATSGR